MAKDRIYTDRDRTAYYAKAAKSGGVPDMWIEDAVADIALRVWQAGRWSITTVRYAAIDAARRYGSHTRSGTRRDIFDPLDEEDEGDDEGPRTRGHRGIPDRYVDSQFRAVDMQLDLLSALKTFTPTQRHNLFQTESLTRRGQARLRLRKAMA